MANTFLGDIPGARFLMGPVANASAASNGAGALIGAVGVAPHDMRVRAAYWQATGADQGANTASYRRLTVVNGGTAGTGTAIVASINLSASKASLVPNSMTVDTSVTIPAGAVLYASHATIGGDDATGTVLRAGAFILAYEVI